MITRSMIEKGMRSRGMKITPEHKRLMNIIWSNVPIVMPGDTFMPENVPEEYPGTAEWLKVIASQHSKVNVGCVSAALDLPF